MWSNVILFTEEILNGKLHFLSGECSCFAVGEKQIRLLENMILWVGYQKTKSRCFYE